MIQLQKGITVLKDLLACTQKHTETGNVHDAIVGFFLMDYVLEKQIRPYDQALYQSFNSDVEKLRIHYFDSLISLGMSGDELKLRVLKANKDVIKILNTDV